MQTARMKSRPGGRFECHAHTCYSNIRLLDSINSPQKLVDYAQELGLTGICVTDHEALGAHVELDRIQRSLIESGSDFKIGRGNEIYLTDTRDPGQRYWHFLLIAKNATGHKMLRELSSTSWKNSYVDRRMERVPTLKSELEYVVNRYGKGNLIASSACLGSEIDGYILKIHRAHQAGNIEEKKRCVNHLLEFIDWCKDLFGEDFYLEVQPARSEEQMIVNQRMGRLSQCCGVKVIVTTDAHYLKPEDREIHKAYLNSKGGERETDAFYRYAYLQSTEDIITNLEGTGLDYQELEDNTNEIYDKIENYSFFKLQQVPEIDVPDVPKSSHKFNPIQYPNLNYLTSSDNRQERYWIDTCMNALEEKGLAEDDTYLSRLEEEADINREIGHKLNTCMFAYPIFLQHYINLFWECGSTIGTGRGSACAGLNHYLLGITQLDPIQWDFPYWRYSNKERIELGDIDIDICPSKRQMIFDKIREERGELGCVQVCTYGTETTKSAIKTACRGYRSVEYPNGISIDVAEYLSSLVPQERGFVWPIRDVIHGNESRDRKPVRTFINEVKAYPGLLEIIEGIEGLICRRGVHASGVIFYDDDPFETACFMKAKDGSMVTQYSLHDAEYCSDVKFDFLVTEIQDVLVEWIHLLQEHDVIDPSLSLREAYDRYLHPNMLPIKDQRLWDAVSSGKILKLFQFDTNVGGQAIQTLRPRNPREMADCNSIMRLVAPKGSEETPLERYVSMREDMARWYEEMRAWGLSDDEKKVLERYYLSTYASPAQQEDLMRILMDKDICHFSLSEANAARKIVGKKLMDKIPKLREKVLANAPNKKFGEYVWETALRPQMGYSFSIVHSTAYTFIGLQTAYAATFFPSIYWNTACLRVDSGLMEDESTNYAKIAAGVGNIVNRGTDIGLIDINHSSMTFEPDVDNNRIMFGMRALTGVNDDTCQQIIANRPYSSLRDFQDKNPKVGKISMLSLIKGGAFDAFGDRRETMWAYLRSRMGEKTRVTLTQVPTLFDNHCLPTSMNPCVGLYKFQKVLRKHKFKLDDPRLYDYYAAHFDLDVLVVCPEDNGVMMVRENDWKRMFEQHIKPLRTYLREHQEELVTQLNAHLLQAEIDKDASGSLAHWEMESLGTYWHDHELKSVKSGMYNIHEFDSLPRDPIVERSNDRYSIYQLCRIVGTVVGKDEMHSSISLLTPASGVINVKLTRERFSWYNRRVQEGDKVMEKGWFGKGTLLMVNGFRRDNIFISKVYKRTPSHLLYRITEVNKDESVSMTPYRYGEEVME